MNQLDIIQKIQVKSFSQKISKNSELEIVPVKTEDFAIINDCYSNVEKQIKKYGGKIVYGWTFHTHINNNQIIYIEAEAHAIWENLSGQLFCISPQKKSTIIFKRDNDNMIKHNNTIPNYRISLIKNNFTENSIKIQELIDYTMIEIRKYINLKVCKINNNIPINLSIKQEILEVEYENKKYSVKDKTIIKLFKVFIKSKQIANNPYLLNIPNGADGIANIIDYKFPYIVEI